MIKFYLAFSVFAFIFNLLVSIYVVQKFKRENPDVFVPSLTPFEKFMAWFRAVLVAFIPIFHIFSVLIWLLLWDNCVEATEEKLWDYIEERL